MDEAPDRGRPPIVHKAEFVDALKRRCKHDEAVSIAAEILGEAKAQWYSMRGVKAPSDKVDPKTVKRFWQTVGGADLQVRAKVAAQSGKRLGSKYLGIDTHHSSGF